jgi:hypothetical protein
MAIIIPFNIYNSKRYAEIQRSLMKVRDEKLGVVTEALQGLRQIKFMGIERQWQGKIMEVRGRELDELWKSNIADTILLFCWFASPILFSAASLTMYAILYGELTPSVRCSSRSAILISTVACILVLPFGLVMSILIAAVV